MFGQEFFPTPEKVISQMLSSVDLRQINTVLEPSAGKGDIVDQVKQKFQYLYYGKTVNIDTVEIEPHLRHILAGKGIRVIHDDFLTLETFKRYDLIIMNPPFSCGEKHLLKALNMQQNGGKVICLLNAETLNNPCTNARRDLLRRLEAYGAKIEYIGKVFAAAERKTEVEVALIAVDIPVVRQSNILAGLKDNPRSWSRNHHTDSKALTPGEFMDRIISRYNFELRAGLELIKEYKAMLPVVSRNFGKDSRPILELKADGNANNLENTYIEQVRLKYWEELFKSGEFSAQLTSKLRSEFFERIDELKDFDFTPFNILQIRENLSKGLLKSVEETIISLFDELSHKWHWASETSSNIHYYNGWKTNKSWFINRRVILPNMACWSEFGSGFHFGYQIKEKLQDIEKVFSYLDGNLDADVHKTLEATLKRAEERGQTRKIPLKYFTVTFYKKGTCHIEFSNMDLLKKFNLFGSQQKGWLPPRYGHVRYADMTAEEKAVIDSFEGEENYARVCEKKGYFLSAISPLELTA